jgi:hypothetical protein
MSHRAEVARQKENVVGRNRTRPMIEQATQIVGLLRKKLRTHHEGNRGTKDLGGGQPRYVKKPDLKKVQVKSTGSFDMKFTKIARLEIVKRLIGSSVSLRQHKDWNLWRSRPPPKRKKGDFKQRRNP